MERKILKPYDDHIRFMEEIKRDLDFEGITSSGKEYAVSKEYKTDLPGSKGFIQQGGKKNCWKFGKWQRVQESLNNL